jgi:hypothetical protein
MTRTEQEERVIARRTLQDHVRGEPIQLVLFKPERVPGEYEEWECRVDIVRGDGVVTHHGRGVDSLQCIITAVAALRAMIGSDPRRFRWLGADGELGLPTVIQEDDPDFIAMIEHLIEAENSRLLWMRKHVRPPNEPTDP